MIHIHQHAHGQGAAPTASKPPIFANPSWLPDGRLVYSRLQKMPEGRFRVTEKYRFPGRVYIHKLGRQSPGAPRHPAAGYRGYAADHRHARRKRLCVQPRWARPTSSRSRSTACSAKWRVWVAPLVRIERRSKTPWGKASPTRQTTSPTSRRRAMHCSSCRIKVHHASRCSRRRCRSRTSRPPKSSWRRGEVVVVNGLVAAKDALYVRKMNGGNSGAVPPRVPRRMPTPPAGRAAVRGRHGWPGGGDLQRQPGAVVQSSGRLDPLFGGYFASPACARQGRRHRPAHRKASSTIRERWVATEVPRQDRTTGRSDFRCRSFTRKA